jgi:hypothetical protein
MDDYNSASTERGGGSEDHCTSVFRNSFSPVLGLLLFYLLFEHSQRSNHFNPIIKTGSEIVPSKDRFRDTALKQVHSFRFYPCLSKVRGEYLTAKAHIASYASLTTCMSDCDVSWDIVHRLLDNNSYNIVGVTNDR